MSGHYSGYHHAVGLYENHLKLNNPEVTVDFYFYILQRNLHSKLSLIINVLKNYPIVVLEKFCFPQSKENLRMSLCFLTNRVMSAYNRRFR